MADRNRIVTLPRFRTRGGATVTMTGNDCDAYSWSCHGCDQIEGAYADRGDAIDEANEHASECYAMPKPGES